MKKIYITIPLIIALASFSGCKKFLETAPDQRATLNTVQKVGELLVSAYPKADYATFTEAASDNAEDKGINVGVLEPVNQDAYLWNDVRSKDTGSPTFYWYACYTAIASANAALEAIAKQPDQTAYQPYKGEALVARAYAHFMLVTLFSKVYDPTTANDSPGIPYVTQSETVVFGQYSRETVALTYDHIEKDLLAGLPLITDLAYTVPKYHFNVAAANAFAARFYLFKRNYNNVINYANLAIPGGAFATVIRPWNTTYSNLGANEFQIAFTQASQTPNLLLTEAPSVWARNSPVYRYSFGNRGNALIYQKANATGWYWDAESLYNYGVPNDSFLKYKELFVRASANADIGDPYTILPQFTTDELLMNRAEAYANLGQNAAALADLNTFASTRIDNYSVTTDVVTAAKIASTYSTNDAKQGLILAVLQFKQQEFLMEGLRWFDIIRLGLTVTHNIKALNGSDTFVTLPPSDPRRVFQLPSQVTLSGVPLNPR